MMFHAGKCLRRVCPLQFREIEGLNMQQLEWHVATLHIECITRHNPQLHSSQVLLHYVKYRVKLP